MLKKGVISNIEGNYASVILPDEDNTVTAMLPFANSILAESVKVGDKCVVAFPDADYVNFADGVIISILSSNEKSKVVYGTTVIVDLSEDTVTPETLAKGVTAHNKDGAPVVGTATLAGAVENKLPSLIDGTATEITADDLGEITTIADYALYRSTLKNIEFPNTLKTIGQYALGYCNNLESIIIPDGVTELNSYVFYYCSNLASVTLPNTLTSIGVNCFSNCKNLASIAIPKSVTSIGTNAFNSCSNLKSLYITDLESWCNTTLVNNASNPLYLSKAENVYINGNLVTNLVIPHGVTSLKYHFSGWESITSVTFPNTITSIQDNAFMKCTSVTEYDFTACTAIPTLTSATAFNGIPSTCVIKVPAFLYDEWKAATNWSTFANNIVAV